MEELSANILIPKDDQGNEIIIYDEASDIEFIMAQMDYTLGRILEKSEGIS